MEHKTVCSSSWRGNCKQTSDGSTGTFVHFPWTESWPPGGKLNILQKMYLWEHNLASVWLRFKWGGMWPTFKLFFSSKGHIAPFFKYDLQRLHIYFGGGATLEASVSITVSVEQTSWTSCQKQVRLHVSHGNSGYWDDSLWKSDMSLSWVDCGKARIGETKVGAGNTLEVGTVLDTTSHRGSQRHLSTENSVLKIHVTLYARCDLSKWESRKTNFRA